MSSIFHYVVHADAGDLDDRLGAPWRAARLMVSRTLYGAAREAMFACLTLQPDQRMLAFLADVLGDESDETRSPTAPRVRVLEVDFTSAPESDGSAEATAKLGVGMIKAVRGLSSSVHHLIFNVRADNISALLIADQLLTFLELIHPLHSGALNIVAHQIPPAAYEMVLSVVADALKVMGTCDDLKIDFEEARAMHDVFASGRPFELLDSAIGQFVACGLPGKLIEAIAAKNGPLGHLTLLYQTATLAFDPPASGIRSVSIDNLRRPVAWETMPALCSLEVMTSVSTGTGLGRIPAGLQQILLHLGYIDRLDDVAGWLERSDTQPELTRLRITTYEDYDPRYASSSTLARVADICRSRSVRLILTDELGRWSLSA